jgi:hypothetical protein
MKLKLFNMDLPNCKPYPKQIMEVDTTEGFIKLFWKYLPEFSKNEDAYEAAERYRGIYFPKRMYSNYESFRLTMNYLKRNKKAPFSSVTKQK